MVGFYDKGVYTTLSSGLKLRNFETNRKNAATKRPT